MGDVVKKSMKFSFLAAAAIALILVSRNNSGWAAGLLVAVLWSILNFSLTIRVFEMAILKKDPKKLSAILLVKFPVLYVGGFFILNLKLFPLVSILAGITLTLAVIGITMLLPRRA